jgi:dihydrolipoamide dehydrogenase
MIKSPFKLSINFFMKGQAMKIAILGGGPGGYTAAIRAAQLGAEVTVVEKDNVGGTCLNWGCIPTKSLLACADVLSLIKESDAYGIEVKGFKPNLEKMVSRKNEIVASLRGGIEQLFKQHGIEYFKDEGTLDTNGGLSLKLKSDGTKIAADKIIIATGSRPAKFPIFDFDQPTVLTSNEVIHITDIPKKLLILGGGVIGCEFASLFVRLGSEVTIVELMPQLLPFEEKRLAKQLEGVFRKSGIKILTGTSIESVAEYSDNGITVKLSNGEEVTADKLLVSIGRALNSDGVGLEEAGVEIGEKGAIKVNEKLETNVPGIYAIGDVIGGIMLAHMASAEGLVAVENALGGNREIDIKVVPNCIFTHPEIATVGLSADRAAEKGIEINTGKFPFAANGKAKAVGEAEGFVQIISEAGTDKIIGAQIMGPHATDLIHELALAIRLGVTAEEVAQTIHAHPTLSETVMEAAEAVHKKAIHIFMR